MPIPESIQIVDVFMPEVKIPIVEEIKLCWLYREKDPYKKKSKQTPKFEELLKGFKGHKLMELWVVV